VNRNTIRALLADARYQVFDNVVFRILLVVAALIVALSFCVSFGEEDISIFFGKWVLSYEQFGGLVRSSSDPRGSTVQIVQSTVVELIAGTFGIMLCIAATAFFTPRLLEKGSADNIFSKPVGRFTLLLSRYFAGIFFVAVLSFLMVFGVQAGLSIMSGYNDWGFLWSAATLVYTYAILQAFSVMVATLARNSVASILLTMILFMFTGCANSSWVGLEWADQTGVTQMMRENAQAAEDEGESAEAEAEANKKSEGEAAFDLIRSIAYACRSVLPRTGDADMLARMLRRSIEGRQPDVVITEGDAPVLHLVSNQRKFEFTGGGLEELDGDGLVWMLTSEGGGTIRITRELRPKREPSKSGKIRDKSSRDLIRELRDRIIEEHGQIAILRSPGDHRGRRIDWRVAGRPPLPLRSCVLITKDDHLYTLMAELPAGALPSDWDYEEEEDEEEAATAPPDLESEEEADEGGEEYESSDILNLDPVQDFMLGASFATDPSMANAEVWYESKFDWDAEWDFNAFVSIGTSLAFTLLMLFISFLRLRRTDF